MSGPLAVTTGLFGALIAAALTVVAYIFGWRDGFNKGVKFGKKLK